MALVRPAADSGSSLATRDHLFISYAVEDRPLAEWLTRKLTADGYLVWCDCFSLLGGDSYPRKIDEAIKERSFRLLAILSEASVRKANPTKERTLALNLGRERHEAFLIPLNVNLAATQLDWMTSDLNYIPFSQWAAGYAQLLSTLERISTPRLRVDGAQAAIETFRLRSPIREQPETLYGNCLPFRKIPPVIRAFKTNRSVTRAEFVANSVGKKAYRVDARTYLSFERTLSGFGKDVFTQPADQWLWSAHEAIMGIPTLNIVSGLLNRTFLAGCLRKGLRQTPDEKSVYFPNAVLKDNKIHFNGFAGKTWLLLVGQRIFRKLQGQPEVCVHQLAFRARVRRQMFGEDFLLQIKVGLHLTDLSGATFKPRTFNSRRKKITKNWWNDKWLNRHFAICAFLDDGGGVCQLGDSEEGRILLSTKLFTAEAPLRIAEDTLSIDIDEFAAPLAEAELLETEDEVDSVAGNG